MVCINGCGMKGYKEYLDGKAKQRSEFEKGFREAMDDNYGFLIDIPKLGISFGKLYLMYDKFSDVEGAAEMIDKEIKKGKNEIKKIFFNYSIVDGIKKSYYNLKAGILELFSKEKLNLRTLGKAVGELVAQIIRILIPYPIYKLGKKQLKEINKIVSGVIKNIGRKLGIKIANITNFNGRKNNVFNNTPIYNV